jgi:hypothetical protein
MPPQLLGLRHHKQPATLAPPVLQSCRHHPTIENTLAPLVPSPLTIPLFIMHNRQQLTTLATHDQQVLPPL